MAASSPSRTSRKFLFLGFGIIVFVAIYSAGWFYAAQRLQETVIRTLAPGGAASVSGECRDIAFRGYPFRIGLFCSKVDVKDTRNDVTASFGALRSAAQI